MPYEFYNPNPCGKLVGDCVIRAVSKALNMDWDSAYMDIAIRGLVMCDMPASNSVWGSYLKDHGFVKKIIQAEYPYDYTIADFCEDNPYGTYIVATGTHVVAVIDGVYYDAGNSGRENPIYYWEKEKENYA